LHTLSSCFCVALHFFQCSRKDVEGRCLSLPLTCAHTRLLILRSRKRLLRVLLPQEHSFKKDRGRSPVLSVSRKKGGTKKPSVPGGLLFYHHFVSLFVVIPTLELWQGRGERANMEQSVASTGAMVVVFKKAPPGAIPPPCSGSIHCFVPSPYHPWRHWCGAAARHRWGGGWGYENLK
jgi:hypothetical protein